MWTAWFKFRSSGNDTYKLDIYDILGNVYKKYK